MSTADRMIELAVRNGLELKGIPAFKEAAAAIADELIAEPTEEQTPDDILFQELDEEAEKIGRSIRARRTSSSATKRPATRSSATRCSPSTRSSRAMSISQKIRRAMLGTAGERMLLVRDKNKLVASRGDPEPEDPGQRDRAHLA